MKRRHLLAAGLAGAGWATGVRPSLAAANDKLDLLVQGGTVIDPANGIQARADLGIRAGRIAALEPAIDSARASRVLDARGTLVVPGLIDFQTHIYPPRPGAPLLAEELTPRVAVTTWVSAGDASIDEVENYRGIAGRHTRCRIYGFVHLTSAVAAQGNTAGGGLEALARRLMKHRDAVIGVALNPARAPSGGDAAALLARAIELAERAETRVRILCNVTDAHQAAPLLERLRPGDVLASPWTSAPSMLASARHPHPAALAARRRGVIVAPAPGARDLDVALARAALEQGLVPDVLSSAGPGLHAEQPLTRVMSEFLNLGLDLEQVLAMTTVNPARLIGREPKLGTLELGAPADVSLLALENAPGQSGDARGERHKVTQLIRPVRAIRRGIPLS